MKIAVSAENNQGENSAVAHHFGRCPFFALVEVDQNEIQSVSVIDNPFYERHQPGQVPAFIKEQNADVMLSGGMGGRAIQFFSQFGIDTATGASGTVKHAVTEFLAGNLSGTAPCAESVEHGHGHEH
jgi:predicted Fe-Mo cluster-binding NifX family protein